MALVFEARWPDIQISAICPDYCFISTNTFYYVVANFLPPALGSSELVLCTLYVQNCLVAESKLQVEFKSRSTYSLCLFHHRSW